MPSALPNPSDCGADCDDIVTVQVPGPTGAAGADGADGSDGANAFTETTLQFTMPAEGANVTVTVTSSAAFVPGQKLFIQGAGYMTVVSKPLATTLLMQNPANYDDVNVIPTTVVAPGALVGPAGEKGANGSPDTWTLTTATFVMPAVSSAVTPAVSSTYFFQIGARAFVETAGYFTVTDIPDGTHVELTNLGLTGNAAPTTVIASGVRVVAVVTLDALSPTAAKGDLIVDDGANAPLSSSNKLAVGSDGEMLVSDSAETTGLKWVAVVPSTGTDNAIVTLNGATGDPIPLQGASAIITDDGDIQTTGGDARGTNAVDLQSQRSGATMVASGAESAVLGGSDNTASGDGSVIVGGSNNVASGDYAIASGLDSVAEDYGKVAHANGMFAAGGDAQKSEYVWRIATTDDTPAEMFLNGVDESATVPTDTSWSFHITLVGRDDAGASAVLTVVGGIKNIAGTTTLIGSTTEALIGADGGATWGATGNVAVTADDTYDSLVITVTGAAATNIRWVARGEITEVNY